MKNEDSLEPVNGPIEGAVLGTALGDSLGLPSEGMSRRRIRKRWRGPLKQRLIGNYGMLSDDTEHTVMVLQSLMRHAGDPEAFQKCLAGKLRWWLACLPAGVGLATAKSILKLWIGFRPGRNGVRSAGNGPVMRAPVIGAFFAHDPGNRRAFIERSTELTHTDPRALEAAWMAGEAAAFAAKGEQDREHLIRTLDGIARSPEWREPFAQLVESLRDAHSAEEFATRLGLERGVSGYAIHTMSMVLFLWLRHRGDFPTIIREAIACGGDTDSVAAIVGGIAGAECAAMPANWLDNIADFPFSVAYMRKLASAAAPNPSAPRIAAPRCWSLLRLPRNLAFLIIVLAHGFRRALPPY